MHRKQADTSGEAVFVVETCQNCKEHHWNTRHDETKYENFYNKVASTIGSRLPNAVVLRNQIPKQYLPFDLYCNLIPNEDENSLVFDQVPRTGSFEVSYKGMLIFSKLQSGYWPNTQLVADKCFNLLSDEKQSKDLTKYFAGNSPTKSGDVKKTVAGRSGRSPNRKFDESQSFSGNASMKMQASPLRQQDSQKAATIMQQHSQQQQQEQSQKQLPEVSAQSLKQASQTSQQNPKFLDESQVSQKVIPVQQQQQPIKSQQSKPELKEAKQEIKPVPVAAAKQEELKKDISLQSDKFEQQHSQHPVQNIEKKITKNSEDYDNDENDFEEPEEPEEVAEEDIPVGSHLKTPEDITGFPIFPDGTKSLLSKNLSREIWDQLKNTKDKQNFSFKEAIFSGSKNIDSDIGVYAGSHDSYKTFAPLFDKIIEDYHGHKKGTKHSSNMDYKQLNAPALTGDDALLIKSTRIRVGRNLANYPLGPGVSNEQRHEIEQKIIKALTSFTGELAGKYYALTSLTDKEKKQLIEDHFLFKERDRFQEASGINKDWPHGRGFFHNDAKTFLVWVNEEDQLRIISMQNGADISQVFQRLSQACHEIEKVTQFAQDDHLGYITSSPTNLGTALRASVHIHLPNLGKNKKELQSIADKYHVQIRGAHGEHTEIDDFIYDISNKRRLGLGEVELVQDMYNGVKAMIKRENELAPPKVKEQPKDIKADSSIEKNHHEEIKEAKKEEHHETVKEAQKEEHHEIPKEVKKEAPHQEVKKDEHHEVAKEAKKEEPHQEVKKEEPHLVAKEVKKDDHHEIAIESKKETPHSEVKKEEHHEVAKEAKKEEPHQEVNKEEHHEVAKEAKREEPHQEVKKEEHHDIAKEVKKEEPHQEIKEIKKEEQHEISKEIKKDDSHSVSKEVKKEEHHEAAKETKKEEHHEEVKESKKEEPHQAAKDVKKEEPHQEVKEVKKDEHHEIAKEAKKEEPHQVAKEVKKEEHHEAAKEEKKEEHHEAAKDGKKEEHHEVIKEEKNAQHHEVAKETKNEEHHEEVKEAKKEELHAVAKEVKKEEHHEAAKEEKKDEHHEVIKETKKEEHHEEVKEAKKEQLHAEAKEVKKEEHHEAVKVAIKEELHDEAKLKKDEKIHEEVKVSAQVHHPIDAHLEVHKD